MSPEPPVLTRTADGRSEHANYMVQVPFAVLVAAGQGAVQQFERAIEDAIQTLYEALPIESTAEEVLGDPPSSELSSEHG